MEGKTNLFVEAAETIWRFNLADRDPPYFTTESYATVWNEVNMMIVVVDDW